jgi:prepilin-type N-terminal cleavage/methylation domain-containing protein
MNQRRGMSLLEVSVTLTITSALLYGAVVLFATFQRIDRAARSRVEGGRELMRLAEQFRSDVYAASDVQRNGGGEAPAVAAALVTLDAGENGRIEYKAVEDGQLSRTVSVAGRISERDLYDLGPATAFSIDLAEQPIRLATLVVTTSAGAEAQSESPRTARRITALVGRDRRHEQDPKQEN